MQPGIHIRPRTTNSALRALCWKCVSCKSGPWRLGAAEGGVGRSGSGSGSSYVRFVPEVFHLPQTRRHRHMWKTSKPCSSAVEGDEEESVGRGTGVGFGKVFPQLISV